MGRRCDRTSLRLLIASLFTDECLIELNLVRPLVDTLFAMIVANGIFPKSFGWA
jgi:hypothetical protein